MVSLRHATLGLLAVLLFNAGGAQAATSTTHGLSTQSATPEGFATNIARRDPGLKSMLDAMLGKKPPPAASVWNFNSEAGPYTSMNALPPRDVKARQTAIGDTGVLPTPAPTTTAITGVDVINTTLVTSTMTATPSTTSIETPLIDGRCYCDYNCELPHQWQCHRKGFECIDGVCVDTRTPDQKVADKQEEADGKDGRCLFTYETGNYTCTHRGFVCQDEIFCVDHRTPEETAEDNKIQAAKDIEKSKQDAEKARIDKVIGGSVGGGITVLVAMFLICCFCFDCRKTRPRTGGANVDPDTLRRAVELEVRKTQTKSVKSTVPQPPLYTPV